MKKIFYILLATFALSFIAVSCEDGEGSEVSIVQNVVITDSQLVFQPTGGDEGYIAFDANGSVSVSSDKAWCSAVLVGNLVNVSCEPNLSNETRYARITLTCNGTSTAITVQQYGEIIEGLSFSDITAKVDGGVISFDVNTNVNIEFETEQDWIHPEYEKPTVTITIDENSAPGTRTGVITYKAGSVVGSVNVTQYPPIVKDSNWNLVAGTTEFDYPDFNQLTSVTIPSEDKYLLLLLPESKVDAENIDDYIFNTIAVEERNRILADMETSGKEFAEYLYTGTQDVKFENIVVGKNYLIAIGYGDNTYVSGQYQYLAVNIEDVRPAYYRWEGKWRLQGTNYEPKVIDETITISINPEAINENVIVNGLFNITTASIVNAKQDWFNFIFDETDGSLYVRFQARTEDVFNYSTSHPEAYMRMVGLYFKAGSSSPTSVANDNLPFGKIVLSEDSNSATCTPLMRTETIPFSAIRAQFYSVTAGGAYVVNSWDIVPLDFTLTRIID